MLRNNEQRGERQAAMRLRQNRIVRVKGWNRPQVHFDYDPETEHIHDRRVMTPVEASKHNLNEFRRRTRRFWMLESQIPVSDESEKLVESLLARAERTVVHEPRSLTPSQLGSEHFRLACNYYVPNSRAAKQVVGDQAFSQMKCII